MIGSLLGYETQLSPKRRGTYRFSECFHTELYSLTFPVLLELCKILAALLRHPVLADLVSVVANSPPHLEWVQMLEGLYRCNKVGELAN